MIRTDQISQNEIANDYYHEGFNAIIRQQPTRGRMSGIKVNANKRSMYFTSPIISNVLKRTSFGDSSEFQRTGFKARVLYFYRVFLIQNQGGVVYLQIGIIWWTKTTD